MDPSDPPDTVLSVLLRWVFHFLAGVIFGATPAVFAFGIASMASSVDLWKAAGWAFLIFCLPCGVIFWLIGLWERGRAFYWILKVLGWNLTWWY
jgi:hypothetical protein